MKDWTDFTLIVDASGSMADQAGETNTAIADLIRDQQSIGLNASVSIITFNWAVHSPVLNVPIGEFEGYTYQNPMGGTALLDAIGNTIDAVGRRLADTPESERPNKVFLGIITDGFENCSTTWTKSALAKKIEEQQKVYNWTIEFLAADLSLVKQATDLGINNKSAYSSIPNAYQNMSVTLRSIRTS
jgi:uncharacterized protein YegL